MRELVYDVAVSLDGFISGEDDDVSSFLMTGDHVAPYLERLASYEAVIMGRKTYEFGYKHGIQPGQRPYPHMEHHIFSQSLVVPEGSEVEVVRAPVVEAVGALKREGGGAIYLCGGGQLAGALLDAGLIDRLILKLNPVIIGSGVRLFGERTGAARLVAGEQRLYASGVRELHYTLGGAAR